MGINIGTNTVLLWLLYYIYFCFQKVNYVSSNICYLENIFSTLHNKRKNDLFLCFSQELIWVQKYRCFLRVSMFLKYRITLLKCWTNKFIFKQNKSIITSKKVIQGVLFSKSYYLSQKSEIFTSLWILISLKT